MSLKENTWIQNTTKFIESDFCINFVINITNFRSVSRFNFENKEYPDTLMTLCPYGGYLDGIWIYKESKKENYVENLIRSNHLSRISGV